jgi:diguanylate cyclase (GGDEF)-like protein/PAS domain S-box-containing protein
VSDEVTMEQPAVEGVGDARGVPRAWSLDEPADLTMEERLRAIVRLAPIGIGIVDLEGHTVLSNDALCEMLGYSPQEFAELTFDQFTHPGDVQRNDELFAEMAAGRSEHFEMDKRFIHSDGRVVWGRLQVSLLRDGGDAPAYAIGMLQDVTEEKRLRDELERLAYQDPLTGLPNRRLFHDRVEHQLRRGERTGDVVGGAVLFADLDDFKLVNDSLGHHTGDELIRIIADRVGGSLRPGDTGGRLGGDEFAVLVEGVVEPEEALTIGHRLRASITRPVQLSGRTITPSVSIGLAMLADCSDIGEVLRAADLAMYRAKELGKDRVVPYSPDLSSAVDRWLDVDAPRVDSGPRRPPGRATGTRPGDVALHAVPSPPAEPSPPGRDVRPGA